MPRPVGTTRATSGDRLHGKRPDGDLPFAEWLRQHLATERAAVVHQLQQQLADQLDEHHRDLVRDLKSTLLASRLPQSKATDTTASSEKCRELVVSAEDQRPLTPELKSAWRSTCERGGENNPHSSDITLADEKSTVAESSEYTTSGRPSGKASATQYFSHFSQDFLNAFNTPSFLEGLRGRSLVSAFVHSWIFEALVSVLILLNCLVMACEVQFVGLQIGHDLGHQSYTTRPDNFGNTFDVLLVIFTCIFLLEFILRCLDLRHKIFCTSWMWFDAFIISMSSIDILSRFGNTLDLDLNPSAIRVARLCRMLRLMKIAKSKEGFAALFLLIKSIQASTHALLWSCLLLVFVMLIAGLLINQLLLGYLNDESQPITERLEVFELFGTYTRMFITMFEFTLGNWAPPQRVLMQNVTEWWGIFVVTYRSVLCFALVNISAAVFNSETSRAAAADEEVVMLNKERTAKRHLRKLEALFKRLDKTSDGRISADEFESLVRDPVMTKCLTTLQVDVEDVQELFHLLSHGDGLVFHDEFVRAMMSMRGEAKSIDLIILMKMARNMDRKIDQMLGHNKRH